MSLPSRFDLESQLFALIRTLGDLQKKVELRDFSFNFYRDKISEIANEILLIELIFKKKGFNLDKILDEMNISEELFSIIPKIKNYMLLFQNIEINENQTKREKLSQNLKKEKNDQILEGSDKESVDRTRSDFKVLDFNFKEDEKYLINEFPVNPMKLAKMSADITSDLITIMDFIKLKMPKISILFELGKRLYDNLKLFPGMEEIAVDVSVYLKEIEWMKIKESDNSELVNVIRKEEFIEIINKKKKITNKIEFNDLLFKFELFFKGFRKNILIQTQDKTNK